MQRSLAICSAIATTVIRAEDPCHRSKHRLRDLAENKRRYQQPASQERAIKDELEDYYEKEIHHGRLYRNLDTLVEKGLLEKDEQDRRTNYYVVTTRGQRELEARRDWEEQYI